MMPTPTPHKPLSTRLFYAFAKYGWVLVLLAVFLLTGCADESATWGASQLDLADAIAQAKAGAL